MEVGDPHDFHQRFRLDDSLIINPTIARTEPARVFSGHLCVTQHSIKPIAIAQIMSMDWGGVPVADALGKIGNQQLSLLNCVLSGPQLHLQATIIATFLLECRLFGLQILLGRFEIPYSGISAIF